MPNHKITGEWRGHYDYEKNPKFGGDFTAIFYESYSDLTGTIKDDSAAGEASVKGTYYYPDVRFTKTYSKPSQSKSVEREKKIEKGKPFGLGLFNIRVDKEVTVTTTAIENFGDAVEYQGSVSDDGETLSGTWSIDSKNGSSAGNWNMRRVS